MPRVPDLLGDRRPDLLALQETKVAAEAFPHAELASAGYHAPAHSGGRWAGVAIAARDGLEVSDAVRGLAGEPDPDEARWLEVGAAGMRLVSVYVPNGRAVDSPSFEAKLAFLEAARDRLAALASGEGPPLLVAGDFNVAPADRDVYDPAAFVGDTHVTVE